ncbi:MAG: nucleotidyltransferase family protein [Microcystis aeruginosa LL13-03]|nr:nucleotidyltransferase family protein [Microcystis aeruginosa LL13-03]
MILVFVSLAIILLQSENRSLITGDREVKKLKIELPQQIISEFCQKWQISEMYLFGSVLREDFRPDSDIDVLVSFQDSVSWGLLEFSRMKRELENLLGRKVDLLTKKSNWIRQREILETAQVIYVAG